MHQPLLRLGVATVCVALLPTLSTTFVAAGRASGSLASARDQRRDQQGGDTAVTLPMIQLGDSIFHGKAANGICFTCHGPTAKGIPGLGPNLTDQKWLHGDGSFTFIVGLVTKGVPKPKEAGAPMLPKGGAKLSAPQIRAVAAYVFSISHGAK